MKKMLMIAADKIVDGVGNFNETEKVLLNAKKKNLNIESLEIVTLAKRWEDKLETNEFKSGASAMAAIERARKLLTSKKADLVVIKGHDFLKTGYEKIDRENFMKLYDHQFTPLEGYDQLVPLFLKYHKLPESEYFHIRDLLFSNYQRTWLKLHPQSSSPDEKWFKPLTKYFRGVDCANPNVDYTAQVILCQEKVADVLKVSPAKRIKIAGNAFTKLGIDGLESLPAVAPYLHLKRTIQKALTEAKVDFKKEFFNGRALLDAYTCYPVVPMGLIHRLGLVAKLSELPEFLNQHEVTVTGGLNLGKAAWNLTSLNALIVMREKLIKSKKVKFGLVHGNGSLGNQQGITILSVNG